LSYAISDHQATPSSEPNLSLSATVNNNNTPSLTSTYANEKMRGGSFNPMILLLIILFLIVKPSTIKASMLKQDV
jgi:hypothetical protein